jgi:hypothetical protein
MLGAGVRAAPVEEWVARAVLVAEWAEAKVAPVVKVYQGEWAVSAADKVAPEAEVQVADREGAASVAVPIWAVRNRRLCASKIHRFSGRTFLEQRT